MISDITMGQFFPGKSVMHRMDPRVKLCLTVYFIVMIFCAKNFVTMGITILTCFVGIFLSKVPMKLYMKSLKPILFIVAFTAILNLFYGTGEPLVKFGPVTITMNGIMSSIMIAVRIVVLIAIAVSLLFNYAPVLNQVSGGFVVIICAVVAATLGAVLFPIKDESGVEA